MSGLQTESTQFSRQLTLNKGTTFEMLLSSLLKVEYNEGRVGFHFCFWGFFCTYPYPLAFIIPSENTSTIRQKLIKLYNSVKNIFRILLSKQKKRH